MVRWRKDLFWVTVLTLCAVVAWTTPDTPAGDRLVVHVLEPFEVNGEVFPAGKLSVKQVRAMSPVATLHEIRIDGDSQGLLLLRANGDRGVASRDELGFMRAADGHLVLESVAIAGQPVNTVEAYHADAGQWYSTNPAPLPVEVASKD
jgi:hypothetical protein